MKISRQQLANLFTYAVLFFLPWQTVWIYDSVGDGEYQKLTHYAVQVLILIAVLLRWKIEVPEAVKKPIKNGWILYFGVLVSCVFSVDQYLSFAFSFHFLFALLLFWLLLDERLKLERIIGFFVAGLIVPSTLGWWQTLIGTSPALTWLGLAEHLAEVPGTSVVEIINERLMRAYGTFPHPNIFGGFLATAILLILWRSRAWLWVKKKIWVATLPLLMLLSATLVITFSRSAWLVLGVGIILIFVWHIIHRIKISKVFLFNFFVIFATVFITAGIFHDAVFVRVGATDRLEEKSLVERKSEYQIIGEVIKVNPFVGVGPGAYTFVLEELNPDQPIWFYQPIHNSFLLFFAETGLLGLVVLIYFFGALVFKKNFFFVVSVISIVFFDHYLWSQWVGLVLAAVVLAMVLRFDGMEEIRPESRFERNESRR